MSNQSWVLPKVSAHIMRHTACTRMAEKRMDVKVLQYIMGHAHIYRLSRASVILSGIVKQCQICRKCRKFVVKK